LRRRKMRKRRAARMETAKGTPTPTPILRPRLELDFPPPPPLRSAAALPVTVVSWMIFKGEMCTRLTLTAHRYGYCRAAIICWTADSLTWASCVSGEFGDCDGGIC
jgi:hypothetical protein